MVTVKVFGAGSIGNHLSYACRGLGWDVTICDVSDDSLGRTREEIYPERYGAWDEAIRLAKVSEVANDSFDVVFVGTPPDSHVPIALEQLRNAPPKVLFIEKPLCPPDLGGCQELLDLGKELGVFLGVGFNHTLTQNTCLAEAWLRENSIGEIVTLRSMTREHWGGIFRAHPWLKGPKDTYLGFTSKGGGAIGEHAHAINIWQHFAHLVDKGRITEVTAVLDMVEEGGAHYDRLAQLHVRTDKGLLGTIVQDVITDPAKKWLRIQGSDGFLEWEVNADSNHDAVRCFTGKGDVEETWIPKKRPDDFRAEIDHIAAILEGEVTDSPVDIIRGLDTQLVVAAALRSNELGRKVEIDYSRGYVLDAIQ